MTLLEPLVPPPDTAALRAEGDRSHRGIGFSGWAQLETVAPSGNVKADMTTNLAFIRELAAKHRIATSARP